MGLCKSGKGLRAGTLSIIFSSASQNEVWKEQALVLDILSTLIPALPYWLCDLGEITYLFWASDSSSEYRLIIPTSNDYYKMKWDI